MIMGRISEESGVEKIVKTEEIFEYVQKQYGTVPEYLWSKSPDSVVLRHKNGKWYAVFMTVEKSKLGLEGNDLVAIMDVKCDPEMNSMIIQNLCIFTVFSLFLVYGIKPILLVFRGLYKKSAPKSKNQLATSFVQS